MTDIGSRAPRRRPGYAWLAAGPAAAAGAIALFIACQPAAASTPPAGLGSASGLAGPGNAGGLSGLGNAGGLAGLNGTAGTGAAPRHRHHGGDHCGCMSPATATMTPTPAQTTPVPVVTTTTPVPVVTATTPVPVVTTTTPVPTGHRPPPAPVPVPVGNTFPVTG